MDPMKIGLIVIGGYFVLKSMGYDLLDMASNGVAIDPGTSAVLPTETTQPAAEQPVQQTVDATTKGAMLNRAELGASTSEGWLTGYAGLLSFHQWNWIYNQLTNQDSVSPESVGFNKAGDVNISIDEWFSWVGKGGISGLRMSSKLRSGGPTYFESASKRVM